MGDESSGKKFISAISGSGELLKETHWTPISPDAHVFKSLHKVLAESRSFDVGDLVTVAPAYRKIIAGNASVDDLYIGVVIEAYHDREYAVTWTTHPSRALCNTTGLFNGDYLLLIE